MSMDFFFKFGISSSFPSVIEVFSVWKQNGLLASWFLEGSYFFKYFSLYFVLTRRIGSKTYLKSKAISPFNSDFQFIYSP